MCPALMRYARPKKGAKREGCSELKEVRLMESDSITTSKESMVRGGPIERTPAHPFIPVAVKDPWTITGAIGEQNRHD